MSSQATIFKNGESLPHVPQNMRENLVPHSSRVNRKRHLPDDVCAGHNGVASNPSRNGKKMKRSRGSRRNEDTPSLETECNIEVEGLATKKPKLNNEERKNNKRKREEEKDTQNTDCASRGERFGMSYKITSKKSRRENQHSPLKLTSADGEDTIPSCNILKPLSLDSFLFHRKLGQGCFGKVLLASDRISGHQVVVKMVKKRPLLKNNGIQNAFNEKRVLELAGGSPYLSFSYATFQTADYLCYVMEYLRGGDLYDFITAREPLDTNTIRFLTAEIICGLQYLHNMGIIHRDISPENIFLDSAGHIKIGDYGLCATNVTGENQASGCVGSTRYMAPEVFSQDSYDSAVDWFSLGALMFKMSTGKYPFYSGDDFSTLMLSVLFDHPAYPEGLFPALKDVLDQLLCKNGETRLAFSTKIRSHPFFAPIDWVKLEAGKISPPFHMALAPAKGPRFSIPVDYFLSQREAQKPPIAPEWQKTLLDFSYTSERWRKLQYQVQSTLRPVTPVRRIETQNVPMPLSSSSSSSSSSTSSSDYFPSSWSSSPSSSPSS